MDFGYPDKKLEKTWKSCEFKLHSYIMGVPNWNPGTHSGHRFLVLQQLALLTAHTWQLLVKFLSPLAGGQLTLPVFTPAPLLTQQLQIVRKVPIHCPQVSLCLQTCFPENIAIDVLNYSILQKMPLNRVWGEL